MNVLPSSGPLDSHLERKNRGSDEQGFFVE
jgi:hypothetical protein